MDELVDVSSGRVGFRGRGREKQETGLWEPEVLFAFQMKILQRTNKQINFRVYISK